MPAFEDRVPQVGREGYRKLTVKEAGTSGLTVGAEFTAQVEFDDNPTTTGTPFAKSNIATIADVEAGTDDSKLVTAYSAGGISTKINELAEVIALGGLVYI